MGLLSLITSYLIVAFDLSFFSRLLFFFYGIFTRLLVIAVVVLLRLGLAPFLRRGEL